MKKVITYGTFDDLKDICEDLENLLHLAIKIIKAVSNGLYQR